MYALLHLALIGRVGWGGGFGLPRRKGTMGEIGGAVCGAEEDRGSGDVGAVEQVERIRGPERMGLTCID